jgi:soluble lytic murein transglycosylase
MANVPLYPVGGTAAPAPLPGPRMSGGSPADFGAIGAQQGVELGAQIQNAASEQMMLQNQVRVNDALNQARQKALDLTYDPQFGYLSQTGRGALERTSGQALPDEYGGRFDEALAEIGSKLTPQQRRVFQGQAGGMAATFREGAARHMLQEGKSWALSVQDSTLKLAGDQAVQHWDDPRTINGGVDDDGNQIPGLVQQAQAAAYASSKLAGHDPSAAVLEAGSHVHAKVIEAALENGNPVYAQNYLQRYSKAMTGDDVLRVQGRVNAQAEASIAVLATDGARQEFEAAAAPTDMDRLHGLVAQAESGGRETNADGSTVTSPKGAKGLMQVLDSTSGDPGFGVTPAKRLPDGSFDPKDRARLGRDYLGAMLRRYGNVPAALAAYNAGPAVVDKAIKDAQASGEPAGTGLWLQDPAIPKETRDYVTGIMGKYNAGAGAAPLPTAQQFVDAAESRLGPNPRPQVLTLTRQRAVQQYELMKQARQQQGDEAEKAAQQALIQNGGDFAALQREHPEMLAAVSAIEPKRYDNLITFAKTLGKGDRTDNMEAYALAWAHPEQMAKMSEPEFTAFIHSNFTDATGKELVKRTEDWRDGKLDGGAGAVNDAALKQSLNDRLTNLGLVWEGAKASKSNKTAYGTVAKFLRDGIFDAQRDLGRKFTPEEVSQFVDAQFQKGAVTQNWWQAHVSGSSTFTPDLTKGYGDVPAAERAEIDKRMPGASEGDKLRAYWTWKQGPRGSKVVSAQ